MKYSYCLLTLVLISTIIVAGCGSSKKSTGQKSNLQDTLPALPLSEIDIPIKVYMPPVLQRIELMVPKEFTSDKWPDYTQSSCDFRYKYKFIRTPIRLA